MTKDTVIEANVKLLQDRSDVGMEKYGTAMCDNKKSDNDKTYWLRNALEEALDLANYLQREIQRVEEEENKKWDISKG